MLHPLYEAPSSCGMPPRSAAPSHAARHYAFMIAARVANRTESGAAHALDSQVRLSILGHTPDRKQTSRSATRHSHLRLLMASRPEASCGLHPECSPQQIQHPARTAGTCHGSPEQKLSELAINYPPSALDEATDASASITHLARPAPAPE